MGLAQLLSPGALHLVQPHELTGGLRLVHELRRGQTLDGQQKLKSPSGVLSTAEAIALLGGSMSLAAHFGDGCVNEADVAAGLRAAVVRDDDKDEQVWTEYLENILKKRGAEWKDLFGACKKLW